MPCADIDQKDKIQILLAEYSSLRSEISERVTSGYQLVAVGIAALAIIVGSTMSLRIQIGMTLGLAIILAVNSRLIMRDVSRSARRVIQLEADINQRAGEELLAFESRMGGEVAGFWFGFFSYPKSLDTKINSN